MSVEGVAAFTKLPELISMYELRTGETYQIYDLREKEPTLTKCYSQSHIGENHHPLQCRTSKAGTDGESATTQYAEMNHGYRADTVRFSVCLQVKSIEVQVERMNRKIHAPEKESSINLLMRGQHEGFHHTMPEQRNCGHTIRGFTNIPP